MWKNLADITGEELGDLNAYVEIDVDEDVVEHLSDVEIVSKLLNSQNVVEATGDEETMCNVETEIPKKGEGQTSLKTINIYAKSIDNKYLCDVHR